jgi:hypothetical protein
VSRSPTRCLWPRCSQLRERSTTRTGTGSGEQRLLVRLGFDLRDGPLQQVYALAQDVRLLREQVLAAGGRAS